MIRVINPGIFTSVQDLGRPGYRKMGVPVGGAMDGRSAALANQLLGNSPGAAVLEFAFPGPELLFESDAEIVLTGATSLASLNGSPISNLEIVKVKAGSTLDLKKANNGFWGYMAVDSSISTEEVLHSKGFTNRITNQYQLKANDEIPLSAKIPVKDNLSAPQDVHLENDRTLSVYKGPEYDVLSGQIRDKLTEMTFELSADCNRMAYVIKDLLPFGLDGIITSPVQPGTVQLTPSGQLIILMRDAQTTGGYGRVLQLTDESIDKLSQFRPGDDISFLII